MLPETITAPVSDCCGRLPYRVDNGPWRCGHCFHHCTVSYPQRQDSINDQLRDVADMADKIGCRDAADLIRTMLV